MAASFPEETRFGAYLKDRRTRLDPARFGLSATRRRTPGLRREEVAQRANISPTWYTWLEQGRGGAPSADVLDRIARALVLGDAEREHLFLLALRRPPEVRYRPPGGVPDRLQRVLDAFQTSPALIRTATWDVVAWNRAATLLLTDYGALAPGQRNVLRLIFCDPAVRAAQHDWTDVARFVVAAFRADAVRAGATAEVTALVEELSRASAEFASMWRDNDVSQHGDGTKRLHHPVLGPVAFEYTTFAVEARPDLNMIVYNPATAADAALIRHQLGTTGLTGAGELN